MKKLTMIGALICALGVIVICLRQYDSGTQYPWHRAAHWYCAEIDMTMDFLVSSEGEKLSGSVGVCETDGKIYEMEIGFRGNAIGFLMDDDEDGIYEVVLEGVWQYRKHNIVITIYKDELFGGLYKELTFTPQES